MTNQSHVKIVDGKLILSLPNAQMPVVWQMDLEQAQSASFTVQEDKKAKLFNLVFKTQEGGEDIIAPFDEKQSAVDILMETSNVLQNAHGQIKPGANNVSAGAPAQQQKSDKLGAVLAIILAVILVGIWMLSAAGPGRIGQGGVDPNRASSSLTGGADPSQSSGVPVSADDFLQGR